MLPEKIKRFTEKYLKPHLKSCLTRRWSMVINVTRGVTICSFELLNAHSERKFRSKYRKVELMPDPI